MLATLFTIVLFIGSAFITWMIWLFGAGVPIAQHNGMGIIFIAVHIVAFVVVASAPPNKSHIGVAAAASIVPIEVAGLFLLGLFFS